MEIEQRYEKATDSSAGPQQHRRIEPLSRIATLAPKSLKSERPDFSTGSAA